MKESEVPPNKIQKDSACAREKEVSARGEQQKGAGLLVTREKRKKNLKIRHQQGSRGEGA